MNKVFKKHHVIILASIVVLSGFMLLVPVQAQSGPPDIPHPLEGRDQCLACHETGIGGATQIPDDHAERGNDTCQNCHSPAAIPNIPHTTEGRDQCLSCHETGIDGATQPPASHEGRGDDSCKTCHQEGGAPKIPHPLEGRENCTRCHVVDEAAGGGEVTPAEEATAEPTIVPTPLAYPKPSSDVNTCVDCHLAEGGELQTHVEEWQVSIHAERGVVCADCHGGDPGATTLAEAMSPEAGYIGRPDRTEIPDLCGGCHANVNLMRQYDLPTDQLDKYKESFHGQQLAKGDIKVATCYDCHDGHATRQVNDPQASVYPTNVPGLCARCHADQAYMAEYNIPTYQFELYQKSVHGVALLERQDTRAPSCATCHGTHGAAPPGYAEVANVCGSCHEATQDYFLKGAHSSPDNPDTPDCVTCHGRYDVSVPGERNFLGSDARHCGECHSEDSEIGATVQELYDTLSAANESYEKALGAIEESIDRGMIMSAEENLLNDARTKLITARAAQHMMDVETVKEQTESSIELSEQAFQQAEAAISESEFRRMAMIIALVVITLIIVALIYIRRELGIKH